MTALTKQQQRGLDLFNEISRGIAQAAQVSAQRPNILLLGADEKKAIMSYIDSMLWPVKQKAGKEESLFGIRIVNTTTPACLVAYAF